MAMASLSLVGGARLLNILSAVKKKAKITSELNYMRKKIEDDARRFAPKDGGLLKASGYSKMNSPTEAEIGFGVHYAVYQEYGTSRFPAQPFLRPAIEANKKELMQRLGKAAISYG